MLIAYFLLAGAPDWFVAFASHSHAMMNRMQSGSSSITNPAKTGWKLKNKDDLKKLLKKAPIKLPMRTRDDVVQADRIIGRDSETMSQMTKTIAAIVDFVRKRKSTISALVSNAMIGRFDCAYFVVKRLTNFRDQETRPPVEFITGQQCLPLIACGNISRLWEYSMREAGVLDLNKYCNSIVCW